MQMKYIVWLLLVVLGSATLLFAQDQNQQMTGKKMSGTICDSGCVTKQAGLATCDPQCTAKSGQCVLVSDNGKVMTIANQEKAMPHMGKHVTMMAAPSESQRANEIRVMELTEEGP
jgi:hypothetical protein